MEKEIWKPVPEFEDSYECSNLGQIRSKDRYRSNGTSMILIKGKMIKPMRSRQRYYYYMFRDRGHIKKYYIHKLVATLFVPNPNNYEEVNHKDEKILNNRWDNLEWVTRQMNLAYGSKDMRASLMNYKTPVAQFTKEGIFLSAYPSLLYASQITQETVEVIKGSMTNLRLSPKGYQYKFLHKKRTIFRNKLYLSENIRFYREARFMSVDYLANESEIKASKIKSFERGGAPNYSELGKLADALQIPLWYLLL